MPYRGTEGASSAGWRLPDETLRYQEPCDTRPLKSLWVYIWSVRPSTDGASPDCLLRQGANLSGR